jgi:replicative DNA helicase
MNQEYKYIEIVEGAVNNRGTFVECNDNWDFTFQDNKERKDTFVSAFMYKKDVLDYVNEHGSISGYPGPVSSNYLFWDIDSSDLTQALEQTKLLIFSLGTFNYENIRVYFSGCKGFHVSYFCPELNDINSNIEIVVGNTCSYLARSLSCFDKRIYNKTRIIRVANTINSKTGLYKIELDINRLNKYTVEEIQEEAKQQKTYIRTYTRTKCGSLVDLIRSVSENISITKTSDRKISQYDLLEGIKNGFKSGNRNDGLTSTAGLLRSRNFSNDIIYSFLYSINSSSPNPIEDRELWSIVNSVNKYSPNPLYIEPNSDDIITMEQAAEKWSALRSKTSKLNSGFKHIDEAIPYFDPGEVLFIAARSGIGKTTMGMQLSHGIATGYNGYGLFASLEMPTTSIFVRSAIIEASKDKDKKLTYEEVTNELLTDTSLIQRVVEKWNKLLIIDKTSVTSAQLQKYYELANEKFNLSVNNFLIDYIGLISGTSDYQSLSDTARSIKQMAKILNTRIIVIAQLSRKAGDGTIPVSIDMLRDSGALEESADYILGMWLSKKDQTRIHCNFIKNRFSERNKKFDIQNTGLYYSSQDYVED